MSGNELYYMKGGKKQDAELHDEILNNTDAQMLGREHSKALASSYGLSQEDIDALYGVDKE
tara:strand:- start:254 stop:436 length:183 start_codon:yes stop_codon:yes gene_type:complete